MIAAATADERDRPDELRHWTEMAGGAAFTEPDITYVRGSWSLGPDEALVIEGDVVASRYWNVLLYSRFLNSLDQRHRSVSRARPPRRSSTAATGSWSRPAIPAERATGSTPRAVRSAWS